MSDLTFYLSIPGAIVGWATIIRSNFPRWVWITAFVSWVAAAATATNILVKLLFFAAALASIPYAINPNWPKENQHGPN